MDALAETLAHIEAHLFEPLSVARLAEAAGLTPWHFSRVFTARLGESVMGYVRGRRLEMAAFRLAAADPPALIDLAFDCGFESQEAFSRAFKRRFGQPPGRFRRTTAKHEMGEHAMTDTPNRPHVTMRDEPVHRGAFIVGGVAAAFDEANKHGIPALWPTLLKALPLAGQADSRTYGVMRMIDKDEGTVAYLAGVEVAEGATLPPGFETWQVPANDYAVFRLDVDGPNLHPQIQAAMPVIWGELIPKSGWKPAPAPDFEAYPDDFNPAKKGAWMEFWIPVTR